MVHPSLKTHVPARVCARNNEVTGDIARGENKRRRWQRRVEVLLMRFSKLVMISQVSSIDDTSKIQQVMKPLKTGDCEVKVEKPRGGGGAAVVLVFV